MTFVMSNVLTSILDKCDIIYDNHVISKEHILRSYWQFLTKVAEERERVSFSFRTSSVCFDAVALAAMLLSCFDFNSVSNDDVIASLQINDMVLYKGQRYRWKGIQNSDGVDMMVIEQDARGKNGASTTRMPYERFKHYIRPYLGDSTVTDGRGIKRTNSNRESILSQILNVPISEVPSVIEVSVAVVSKKQRMYDLCNNLKIRVNNSTVSLFDIFPSAYYTGTGSEIPIGRNPSKAMPVIRFTEHISVARDMILERGSTTIALLVMNNAFIVENSSELDDLIGRSKPQIIHISTELRSDAERRVLTQYSNMPVFACTSRMLEKVECIPVEDNYLSIELGNQLDFIKKPNIITPLFENTWSISDYRTIQSRLNFIRNLPIDSDIKDNFVISAHALMNLFSTAIFPLSWVEISINNSQINNAVKTPDQRIQELWEYAILAGQFEQYFLDVIEHLEKQNAFYKRQNPKFEWLKAYLNAHSDEKILIVVPKAYYINILANIFNVEDGNIVCTTNRRINSDSSFDAIISLCWTPCRAFDPLQCYLAQEICIPLYIYEQKMFDYRAKDIDSIEQLLSGEASSEFPIDSTIPDEESSNTNDNAEEMLSYYFDLEKYIDEMNSLQLQHFIRNTSSFGNTAVSEICYIGQFSNGDHVFFSKQYMAVVYSPENNTISEKAVKDLSAGDILVFTRRDDFTRNIVDIIFERLLKGGKLHSSISEAKNKASYWKIVLQEYKVSHGLKHREIAQQLRDFGISMKASSIRQWLAAESHIIGPQQIQTMQAIADLTHDIALSNDVNGYFEACRTVRSARRQILKMISDAINDKLSGNIPPAGSDLEVVYQNVDKLAETMELEFLVETDNKYVLQIGFVNRPISDEEVSL